MDGLPQLLPVLEKIHTATIPFQVFLLFLWEKGGFIGGASSPNLIVGRQQQGLMGFKQGLHNTAQLKRIPSP